MRIFMTINHQTLLPVIIRNVAAGKGHLLLFKAHLIDTNTIHWQWNKYTMTNSMHKRRNKANLTHSCRKWIFVVALIKCVFFLSLCICVYFCHCQPLKKFVKSVHTTWNNMFYAWSTHTNRSIESISSRVPVISCDSFDWGIFFK